MKAISRLSVTDMWTRTKEGDTLKEIHVKTRYWFGIKVFQKDYNADTEIVETRKSSGYK